MEKKEEYDERIRIDGIQCFRKKNGALVQHFGIKDCPLWLYKWFSKDVLERHNSLYWSRLKEIHDRLEFLERLYSKDLEVLDNVQQPVEPNVPLPSVFSKKDEPNIKKIRTFGGEEEVDISDKQTEE